MASSQGTVSLDNLGQAAYTGKLAEIVDALNNDKQLAHMADTVGNVVNFTQMCLQHGVLSSQWILPYSSVQGRGDGPKASTSWASEATRVKAELECATLWVCFAYMPKP